MFAAIDPQVVKFFAKKNLQPNNDSICMITSNKPK